MHELSVLILLLLKTSVQLTPGQSLITHLFQQNIRWLHNFRTASSWEV